ncbi:molecular chaperone DnaJ [Mesorhizobium sp. M4B.F.Ca.ET.215.01.1.1]|uniref:DnaJ domain-containing protein n=1 Tax=unclassified Mesorhizobium TaxID=325217 RepID=UPI000FCA6587|nr:MULTISPECIES: DnaJ domain-containing protein [unclassified Mesorhizobium]RUW21842.1 molecular chaperone DnaJ [Mesorhizobium sp. M4B.F.Ca.ET.013.02.1.1]RVD42091.1 molecular chaperone DnaJ [Mesorhizobium sp. M4B.F.Ca.ET.019.03.1.1]RWF65910.1 MAG: molecular chaperone DnaJ [Mesorhizobium sp.]TGQ08237.1 molecular chaperone DnaJ [Mesorhizobium sp. M4B.F.Ca.ET.215.01.1.1]TGQ32846.1 molecular chaperone DnaJ [Mesorhizobium sp. M4B.F.Ca.ET.214.01.1.1]
MGILIALVALLLVLLGAVTIFVRADPAKMADGLKTLGPILLALAGAAIFAVGRSGLGGIMLVGAAAWYGTMRINRPAQPPPRKRSTVRTAALEMELDHKTGGLEGLVLAGRHEGKMLGAMNLAELQHLYRELSGDPESRQLLETYLDGRFPVWRKNAEPDSGEGLGVAPGAGAMTKEEAYKILGLEAGAAAADVRKAHRRLMQRLHPDIGGTSFLAARINEAKDVLLSNHN